MSKGAKQSRTSQHEARKASTAVRKNTSRSNKSVSKADIRAVKPRSELNRRRVLDSAKVVIARSSQDPHLLEVLLRDADIADYVRRSLCAKAAKDSSFAKRVAGVVSHVPPAEEALPAWSVSDTSESQSSEVSSSLWSSRFLPQEGLPVLTHELLHDLNSCSSPSCSSVSPPSGAFGAFAQLSMPGPRDVPPRPRRSVEALVDFSTADNRLKYSALLAGATAVMQRIGEEGQLLAPRLGQPESLRRLRDSAGAPLVCESSNPQQLDGPHFAASSDFDRLLKRRRRRSKGPATPQLIAEEVSRCRTRAVLGTLTTEIVALIMSYVDVKTKARSVQAVSSSIRGATQCRQAWDPLCLDQATGRAFLRLLKRRDPLGCFADAVSKTKRCLPKGFFEVMRLEAVLMDPERVEVEQSDTEDEAPKQRPLVVSDPLDEVCKRLRSYFPSVCELHITNIEDYRMDYRFVGLRSVSLADFGFVELTHCSTTPPTYTLLAHRKLPPRLINVEDMKAENRARMPAGVCFDFSTTISEREALYLAEHRNAYKNGEDFHLVHAFFRTVRSHTVRRRYKAVVEALRQRFPQQFASRTDPSSPFH